MRPIYNLPVLNNDVRRQPSHIVEIRKIPITVHVDVTTTARQPWFIQQALPAGR